MGFHGIAYGNYRWGVEKNEKGVETIPVARAPVLILGRFQFSGKRAGRRKRRFPARAPGSGGGGRKIGGSAGAETDGKVKMPLGRCQGRRENLSPFCGNDACGHCIDRKRFILGAGFRPATRDSATLSWNPRCNI